MSEKTSKFLYRNVFLKINAIISSLLLTYSSLSRKFVQLCFPSLLLTHALLWEMVENVISLISEHIG